MIGSSTSEFVLIRMRGRAARLLVAISRSILASSPPRSECGATSSLR